jgi:hypothetical protein
VRTRFLANSELHAPVRGVQGERGQDDRPRPPRRRPRRARPRRPGQGHRQGGHRPGPNARYKVGSQARLAPVARRVLGDRWWDAFMRRMVPFPAPQ